MIDVAVVVSGDSAIACVVIVDTDDEIGVVNEVEYEAEYVRSVDKLGLDVTKIACVETEDTVEVTEFVDGDDDTIGVVEDIMSGCRVDMTVM